MYLEKIHLIKIEGKLHAFNGKWYFPLDKKQLSVSVKNELYQYVIKSGYRLVNSISKAVLETFDYPDYPMAEYIGWMGFENGVWNINDNQFYLHEKRLTVIPNTYILQGISYPYPYPYSPDPFGYSTTPNLDGFLAYITGNDIALIQRIWEMIGYILTPDIEAKSFFLLQGVPNSGKSVLGQFLESFFPQGRVTSLDISRLGGQFLPDALVTSCLNLSMDLPNQPLSATSIANIKKMTGKDLTIQEAKYKDAKPFRSHCKLLFSTNHPLILQRKDEAFLDRIVCIPFNYSVEENYRNHMLLQVLLQERQQAAYKAIYAYQNLRNRNYKFSGSYLPDIKYTLSTNSIIEDFIAERCRFVPYNEGRTYTRDLYKAYIIFCKEKGYDWQGDNSFSQRLSSICGDRVYKDRWRNGEDDLNGYRGIVLKRP